MELIEVVYTNKEGYKEVRKVPKDVSPTTYDEGIFVGPPDITGLGLKKKDKLVLNNALVEVGYLDFPSLSSERANLLRLIKDRLKVSDEEARKIRWDILHIYQRDFYPEKFED